MHERVFPGMATFIDDQVGKGVTMQKWLLVSNCQQFGLANCLRLIGRVEVDSYAMVTFEKDASQIDVLSYDHIVVAPQYLSTPTFDFSQLDNVTVLPYVFFDAYHPDLCYIHDSNDKALLGPIGGGYHSMIAFCGFSLGLTVERTLRYFSATTFDELGYLDLWNSAKKRLLDTFNQFGYDISKLFVQWARTDEFMYTCNHPKIRCLRDLASCVLERAGIQPLDTTLMPHDNLLNGAVFPVYPDVARALSIRGSYLYKNTKQYQFLTLGEFVRESFEGYRNYPQMTPHPAYRKKYEVVKQYMEQTL